MKLIVMIPAYNEEDTIGGVIKSIPRTISGIDEIEVLVIDDGSCDSTVSVAKKAGAHYFVFHEENKGLGNAFQSGIKAALENKADIIVNIDADGQFDTKEIPLLIQPILEGRAGMVTGSRFTKNLQNGHIPVLKKIGNKAFTQFINKLTEKNFSDTQCGFRAYSQEAALRLNLFGDFTYTQEVFLDLARKGIAIEEVPIQVRYFKERRSKISGSLIKYGINSLAVIFRTFRDYYPLRFFGIPGFTIFLLGFCMVFYSGLFWLVTHMTAPIRMIFFVGVFLFTFGFLLLVLALIADMMKRLRQNQEEILYKMKHRGLK